MEQLPLVTTVICNKNYGKWIGDAIRSVYESDYPNKALAIVDDGSTDNSWEVIQLNCNLWPENDVMVSPIYIGKIKNVPTYAYKLTQSRGPSKARNIAIKMTWEFTQLFQILDSDDMLLPTKLSKFAMAFINDPNIGITYGDYDILHENGNRIYESKQPYSRDVLLRECIIHSGAMVSKLALSESGLYDEQLRCAEDYDLWLRITEKRMGLHIPESLTLVRSGSHDSTNTVKPEIWNQCMTRVREKLIARQQQ